MATGLTALVQACRSRQLRLLLDLTLDQLEAGHPLVQQHPNWFSRRVAVDPDSGDAPLLPDPRF
ncbi:hypothetical protein ACFS07_31090 [Undibacterium arcticum]